MDLFSEVQKAVEVSIVLMDVKELSVLNNNNVVCIIDLPDPRQKKIP